MVEASHGEAADFASSLPDSLLQCRDFGHTWRPFTARWEPDARAWERTLRCTRCQTTRVQLLNAYGGVLRGHYGYPDGYLHARLGRLTGEARDALRLESVVRLSEGRLSGTLKGARARAAS